MPGSQVSTPKPCFFDTNILIYALDIQNAHDLQFFDALLVACAESAGCDILFSEDMADGAKYGSITVRNPFTH